MFRFKPRRDRATKILSYLGEVIVNGRPDVKGKIEPGREFEEPRGEIVSADGVVLARSVENPPGSRFRFQREYPTGELFAHLTGYYSFAFGATQLERSQNAVLTGETGEQQLRNLPNLITGADDSGSVRLTLRSDLQQVARDALGEREGVVVVMNPRSGAVRARSSATMGCCANLARSRQARSTSPPLRSPSRGG